MFGKKKSGTRNPVRNQAIVRETLERIVIRGRSVMQTAYCAYCGRLTHGITPEQEQEIFDRITEPIENIHLAESGPARLLCAGSIAGRDEEQNEKE